MKPKPAQPPRAPRAAAPSWWPYPLISILVAAVWLLLQQSLAPAQLLVAALLALGVPHGVRSFLGPATRPRRLAVALRLGAVVLWDIVVSNVTVARLVLDPRARPQPAWVPMPLELRHPTAITLLASIITLTPGTVSCVVDDERWQLLVHALDCADPGALAAQIQQRYELPLRQIFEGPAP